jgi:para-aminobenzoate synthetase component 1
VPEDPVVPLVEELVPPPDPVRCCEQFGGLPYRIFFDSAARGTRLGRYSFLAADPVAVVRSKGARTECVELLGSFGLAGSPRDVVSGDALDTLRALLAPYAADPVPGLPPFQGGGAGYLAYDWGRVHERIPAPRHDDLGVPDVVLGVYDWVLAWDHEASRAWLVSTGLLEASPAARRPCSNV